MEKDAVIFVAGHKGLVGSSLVSRLKADGFNNITTRTREEMDLEDEGSVFSFFREIAPQYVFMAAGRSGGILANSKFPAEFITENLRLQNNIIRSAWEVGTKKLLYIGCSCIYPREAPQPINEASLLQGPLEPTSEPFAIAKIAGITACQAYRAQYGSNFIAIIPATLFGPRDNFNPQNSHFLSGLLARFHSAKVNGLDEVTVWGSGNPVRELLFVDDFADACLFLMENYSDSSHLNVGSGVGITIRETSELVKEVVGFQGKITFDLTRPDGAPKKLLDSTKMLSYGWKARTSIREGIERTYDWYLEQKD